MREKKKGPAIVLVLLLFYLLLPLAVSVIYSMFDKWTKIIPEHFNISYYVEIFKDSEFISALGRTLLMCIVPILITIFVVLLALFVTKVYFPKLEKYIQIICMIPYTIQGVILSVSILSMYVGSNTFLSNRLVMLFGAYCIIILPYIYQGIVNGMNAINMPMLLEAAQMLGASKLYAFFKVVVPNIISAIVVSSLLAVGVIFGDYVLVRNLTGTSFQNLQIYLYQAMKIDSRKSSTVFVLIMMVTFIISAVVLYLQSRGTHKEKK